MGKTNIPTPEQGMDYGDRMYMSEKPYEEQMRKITTAAAMDVAEFPESEFNQPGDNDNYEEMEYWFPWGFDFNPEWELYPLPQLDELPPFGEVPGISITEEPTYVYATEDEGKIWQMQYSWAGARDSAVGYGTNTFTSHQLLIGWANPVVNSYHIDRGFLDFDLSGISGSFSSVKLIIDVSSVTGSPIWCVQESTHTPPVLHSSDPGAPPVGQDSDFSAFTGGWFGSWEVSPGELVMEFNSTGTNYILHLLGSVTKAKLCIRDYTYDYLDVEPVPPAYPGTINRLGNVWSASGGPGERTPRLALL